MDIDSLFRFVERHSINDGGFPNVINREVKKLCTKRMDGLVYHYFSSSNGILHKIRIKRSRKDRYNFFLHRLNDTLLVGQLYYSLSSKDDKDYTPLPYMGLRKQGIVLLNIVNLNGVFIYTGRSQLLTRCDSVDIYILEFFNEMLKPKLAYFQYTDGVSGYLFKNGNEYEILDDNIKSLCNIYLDKIITPVQLKKVNSNKLQMLPLR